MLGRFFRKATRSDLRTATEGFGLEERPSSNYDEGEEGGLKDHMIEELHIRDYKGAGPGA
jgi:hypothetical protein